MYCYECSTSEDENTKTYTTNNVSDLAISNYAKKGNGYVKITFVEEQGNKMKKIKIQNK